MADPVIPASETVWYVLSFSDAGAAGRDSVASAYTGQEVLLFFIGTDTVTPVSGFQTMISLPGPVVHALYTHPNLLFALDMQKAIGSQVLTRPGYSAAQMANLILILANYGSLITMGVS